MTCDMMVRRGEDAIGFVSVSLTCAEGIVHKNRA